MGDDLNTTQSPLDSMLCRLGLIYTSRPRDDAAREDARGRREERAQQYWPTNRFAPTIDLQFPTLPCQLESTAGNSCGTLH